MKILLSHRYFWPDTPPYALILRSIARRLASDGHDVTVFTSQPSYQSSAGITAPKTEVIDGFRVVRMPIFRERKGNAPLRAINVLNYARGLRGHILKTGDYDIITASTFPPIAAGWVAAKAAKKIGARFIYHCMDIHPELSLCAGQLTNGRLWRRLQAIDNATCAKADAIIVLSQDMKETIHSRPGAAAQKIHIINNFLLENFDTEHTRQPSQEGNKQDNYNPIHTSASTQAQPETDSLQLPADKFTILFAGNIGNFQSLDSTIAAAKQLTDLKDLQFWFMGEGAAKARLMAQADALIDKTVFFLSHQHHCVAQKLMGQADLNLVSLKPLVYKVSYPSKTMASFAQGRPILAVIEPTSELGRMVVSEQVGYNAPADDPDAIAACVRHAYQERARGAQLRDNTRRLYASKFAKDKLLNLWSELITSLGST